MKRESRIADRGSRKCLVALALSLMAMALGGCQSAGFVAQVFGKNQVPAVYALEDRPTLVLVEDAGEADLTTPDLAGLIAGRIGQQLESANVVSKVIPFNDFTRLKADTPAFSTDPKKWNIARIGRELGAEQVVYVAIQRWRLSEEGVIYRPYAEARVKVIDAAADTRRFPPAADQYGSSGHPVITQESYGSMDGASQTTHMIVARRLADAVAREVAWLFYEHKLPEPGDKLPG